MLQKIKLKLGPEGPSVPNAPPRKIRRGRPPARQRRIVEDETAKYSREEHCILRMPPSDPLTVRLREIVKRRHEFPLDFEIQWKDSRHGVLKFEGETLLAKLVDLPCIIESQKTFDRRQFTKVADISQMIVIERPPVPTSDDPSPIQSFLSKPASSEEFIVNSGITPPLKYCRLRRFRKRVNRRTLESIEREVTRLLNEDMHAEKVETMFVDPSELDDRLAAAGDDDNEDIINVDDYEDSEGTQTRQNSDDESSVDSEFAAELEDEIARALEEGTDEEEEEDEAEEGGDFDIVFEQEEEEEEEDNEIPREIRILLDQQKVLREEMRDLEDKIREKHVQKDKAMNTVIQKRFEDIIKKLDSERLLKQTQLEELEIKIEESKEEAAELAVEIEEDQHEGENESDGNADAAIDEEKMDES